MNRAFEQVDPDGTIHCYTAADPFSAESWLRALTAATELRVTHAVGASPCMKIRPGGAPRGG